MDPQVPPPVQPEIPPPLPPAGQHSTAQPNPPARSTLYWLRDLSLSVMIAVMVILFLYQPVKVEGTSMMPSIVDQERIFINKFVYRFGAGKIGLIAGQV